MTNLAAIGGESLRPQSVEHGHESAPSLDVSDLLKQGHEAGLFGVNHPRNHKGSRSEFMDSIMKNFDLIDGDQDDTLSKDELKNFIAKSDTSAKDKMVAQVLLDHFDKVENFDDHLHGLVDGDNLASEGLFFDSKITKADLEVLSMIINPKEFEKSLKAADINNGISAFSGALFGFAIGTPLIVGGSAVALACSGPAGWAGLAVAAGTMAYPFVKLAQPLAYDMAVTARFALKAWEVNSWNYFEPVKQGQ